MPLSSKARSPNRSRSTLWIAAILVLGSASCGDDYDVPPGGSGGATDGGGGAVAGSGTGGGAAGGGGTGGMPPFEQSCVTCHDGIEDNHAGFDFACVMCHGGDDQDPTMEGAHVQPSEPVTLDATTLPEDYELEYQQFINPSNLRVAEQTCGTCHPIEVDHVKKSLMATDAGHFAGGHYLNGLQDSKTPKYSVFPISDDDGDVPPGAIPFLEPVPSFDDSADPSLAATHYQAVPGQACGRCHLYSRGKGFRGAENMDGVYRSEGCAACHMLYANDGLSQSADLTIDHSETGHSKIHQMTKAVPTEQCLHCHHRGARIGLNFTGRSQMPPRLPSGPGVAGTTDERFNENYHFADPATNPPDIHHEVGMHCIDCHTSEGIMGDGNIYGHMDQATKIECRQCHGMPGEDASLVDNDGKALNNMAVVGGDVTMTSKVTGQVHVTPQLSHFLDVNAPGYSPEAAAAMDSIHLKADGGLECSTCHADWMPNCFGCHFERDQTKTGVNLLTGETEIGKVSTNNKLFESFKHFAMGWNSEGRMAPYVVSCHPIADITAPDGSTVLDFIMPATQNGKSGLGHNPVEPHTNRKASRTCVECHRSPPSLGLGSGNYDVARQFAFAAGAGGVDVYERWADPVMPAFAGNLATGGTALGLAVRSEVVSGRTEYLFVAAGASGALVYDFASGVPANPAATYPSNAIDVSYGARYLYVVDAGVGVRIFDIDNLAVTTPVATIPIVNAQRAVLWGMHLFVAAGADGLFVVDVSDHTVPSIVGSLGGFEAADVRLYAHHQPGTAFAARAYVADPSFGVRILDLLPEFSSPTLVAPGLPLTGGAHGLDTYARYVLATGGTPSAEHDYLYVAAGDDGLAVFDISNPDSVLSLGTTALGGTALDVDVSSQMNPPGVDDYAMVANLSLGVQVVVVSDPTAPTLLNATGGGTSRVIVEVQQLDRFIDEQGTELKENSHPGAAAMGHADLVRMLSAALP